MIDLAATNRFRVFEDGNQIFTFSDFGFSPIDSFNSTLNLTAGKQYRILSTATISGIASNTTFSGSYSVVPEPSSSLCVMLSSVFLLRRKR